MRKALFLGKGGGGPKVIIHRAINRAVALSGFVGFRAGRVSRSAFGVAMRAALNGHKPGKGCSTFCLFVCLFVCL